MTQILDWYDMATPIATTGAMLTFIVCVIVLSVLVAVIINAIG